MANTVQLKKNGQIVYPITDRSCVIGLNEGPLMEFIYAWDGSGTPVPANIPAGVVVTYDGNTYTGTLAASASTSGYIYLVYNPTSTEYDRYGTDATGGSYAWKAMGDTTIQSPDIADNLTTNDPTKALSAKQGKILNEEVEGLEAEVNEKADQAELSQLRQEVTDLTTEEDETSVTDPTMQNGHNPTISKVIEAGKTVTVKVQGMTGTAFAEAGVNNANATTFKSYRLDSSNNWETSFELTQDSALFWWVTRNVSGERGVFSVLERISKFDTLGEEINEETERATEAENTNARNIANNTDAIEQLSSSVYQEDVSSVPVTMTSAANPTISKIIKSGKTVKVSIQGMSGTQFAECGVNNRAGTSFQNFRLDSDNNWELEFALRSESALFWAVCRDTSGEQGVFSVSVTYDVKELIDNETERATKAENTNAAGIAANSAAIKRLTQEIDKSGTVTCALSNGRNDIFSIGEVKGGDTIEMSGQIDFTPSETWYLSIQSDQGEVISYRIDRLTNSYSKIYTFPANKTEVKIAISIYGSVYGNISASYEFSDSYNKIKESIDGLNKFAYDLLKGCEGSGVSGDEYTSQDGTAGFTLAMSVLSAKLGGRINVPSGQYLVSAPIILNENCVNIEGSIWNYPNHPNGVYESNFGSKIKIASQNIPALKITRGNGFRISQIGFAGTIPNGDTKGVFDKTNPFVNCGILMERYHDQYEIRRVSCEGLAVGFAGNKAGMDAGIIECFNADGCNIGIYCENTDETGQCYYFKMCHNILSDCPAFGIYMNGMRGDGRYAYFGAEIFGNVLIRNGGGFTAEQITAFGGDSECAAVFIKGLSYASFHDNIIHSAGTFSNASSGSVVPEYQTRKFCILDAEYSMIVNNQFMNGGTSVDIYGNSNNISNNSVGGELVINGSHNNVSGNRINTMTINGDDNMIQSNRCTYATVVVNGNNNTIVVPSSYTITDNGTGNTIVRL